MVKKIHTCINKMEFLILKAIYFMKKDNHYYEVAEESSNPFKDNTWFPTSCGKTVILLDTYFRRLVDFN